ncbi:hypothetical protein BX666DRAFT_1884505 [Dichotomocladium elegans]|nr:hypothetical protein BX666DRAFT_1884505 [Dichotomocladium elegans]
MGSPHQSFCWWISLLQCVLYRVIGTDLTIYSTRNCPLYRYFCNLVGAKDIGRSLHKEASSSFAWSIARVLPRAIIADGLSICACHV